MSNFSFIPQKWNSLISTAQEAEKNVYSAPLFSALLSRKSLEQWVRWIYQNDSDLELPFDDSLSALIHNQVFKNIIAPLQFEQINLIRKLGNNAVHTSSRITAQEALHSLKLLYNFIAWVTQVYNEEKFRVGGFNESLIEKESGKDKTKAELKVLEEKYLAQQEKLEKLESELLKTKSIKEQNIANIVAISDPNEALTRKLYIDILLVEAGWDPNGFNVAEYPVKNCMPQAEGYNGHGRVDYVLWGNDGKPLAVVEAKRTTRDPREGKHQAQLYADCLQKEFGQRPIIFFTNGFKTWIWDDLNYASRKVFGFYTKDELEIIIQRRTFKKPLVNQVINNAITDRYYQHEAIRSIAEVLEKNQRDALLVMATGTGKTRVAASLIDFLSKAGWAKRVLFLADRNALIHQAKVNLNDYLPNLPAVDLTKEKEDESSRIVFSTYQTIINMIDGEVDGDNRFYGVGHFDLIIFDEIHRSVYNTYRHIFNYFDGIRIGLTATPKSEGDKDTYGLFGLQPNVPTYAYELEQAVNDKFLVPPKAITVPVRFIREGVKYADLSAEEKEDYETHFEDPITGIFPEEIDATALNDWLFNIDTVDKVIGHLMQNGIKVEGGDKLAKTIVFARSHLHAKFIEERFNIQFPEYKGDFLKVIDNREEYRYDLLNKFKVSHKMPQIAVSVDMLDTGIDVPEVCNLVFFKPVRSSSKFWQMIGRGTRLCPNLFGIEEDKKEFIIFDLCQNFEFFNQTPKGFQDGSSKPISQRLFELRLRLGFILLNQEEEDLKLFGQSLIDILIEQTQRLNTDSFIVRQHWEEVLKYKDKHSWNALSDLDIKEIFDHIAPLIKEVDQDEKAKRFDLLMLNVQMSILLNEKRQIDLIKNVISIGKKLTKKLSIPSVAKKIDTINEIQKKIFWEGTDIIGIERVRNDLRDLIKFLDPEKTVIHYTNYEDEILEGNVTEHKLILDFNDLETYKRNVEQYLKEHSTNIIIYKIRNNEIITEAELNELNKMLFDQGTLGTKEEFVKAYGEQPLGKFIRSIVGLDSNAAKLAFGDILNNQTLNSQQIRFMDTVINFFTVKGIVEPAMLFEPPFTDINSNGIMGIFDEATSTKIINLIEKINHTAEVA